MSNFFTKVFGVAVVILLIALKCLYSSNEALSAKNKQLETEISVCSNSLKIANSKILEANRVNIEQSKIVAKYNSMKKKDYENANNADLDALHTLDVLLESKSVIE